MKKTILGLFIVLFATVLSASQLKPFNTTYQNGELTFKTNNVNAYKHYYFAYNYKTKKRSKSGWTTANTYKTKIDSGKVYLVEYVLEKPTSKKYSFISKRIVLKSSSNQTNQEKTQKRKKQFFSTTYKNNVLDIKSNTNAYKHYYYVYNYNTKEKLRSGWTTKESFSGKIKSGKLFIREYLILNRGERYTYVDKILTVKTEGTTETTENNSFNDFKYTFKNGELEINSNTNAYRHYYYIYNYETKQRLKSGWTDKKSFKGEMKSGKVFIREYVILNKGERYKYKQQIVVLNKDGNKSEEKDDKKTEEKELKQSDFKYTFENSKLSISSTTDSFKHYYYVYNYETKQRLKSGWTDKKEYVFNNVNEGSIFLREYVILKEGDKKYTSLTKKVVLKNKEKEIVITNDSLEIKIIGKRVTITNNSKNKTKDLDYKFSILDNNNNQILNKISKSNSLSINTLKLGSYKVVSSIIYKGKTSKNNSKDFKVSSSANYDQGKASKKDKNPKTAEFLRGGFLEQIKADAAYQQGWTGKGVKLGILDSGIDTTSGEFKDRVHVIGDYYKENGKDGLGHGTHVAGIIGAAKDGKGMHGVAYESELYISRILNSKGSGSFESIQYGLDSMQNKGMTAINMSLGTTWWDTSYKSVDNIGKSMESLLKQNTSIIVAAGNNSGSCKDNSKESKCSFPAAIPALKGSEKLVNGSYDGAFIAVGSVNSKNEMAYYSNKAGMTKDWFMVAPGGDFKVDKRGLTSTVLNGKYGDYQGTSMAAPVVTGAFGLIAHKFPYLKGKEIRDILFATTTDLGKEGVDEIYGHGLLNIEKAMKPIGEIKIPLGGYVSKGGQAKTNKSGVVVSAAMAGAFKSASLGKVLVLDDFDRGYTIDGNQMVSTGGLSFNSDSFFEVTDDKGLIVGLNVEDQSARIGMRVGTYKIKYTRTNDLFGTTGDGALEISSAKTDYFTLETPDIDGFKASITYGIGSANGGGMIKNISNVKGMSAKVEYEKNGFNIGLGLPMRVVSGTMEMEIPQIRQMSGEIETVRERRSLVGEAQAVSLNMGYNMEVSKNTTFTINGEFNMNEMNKAGQRSGRIGTSVNWAF
jgi:subtilisin family serine protease